MSPTYKTGQFTVYPHLGELHSEEGTVKIRPKTCELLMMLLQADGEILSKDTIIQQVWKGVSVDEQVVFQSIKEIRKLFANSEVIKTHPRKGYSWALSIEKLDTSRQSKRYKSRLLGISVVGLILLVGLFLLITQRQSTPPFNAGSIVVLPSQTSLTDSAHRWIKYGMMDLLIQKLAPSEHYAIMQIDDVLEIIKRAQIKLPENESDGYSAKSIEQLFLVSGANLIIQQTLTGSPRDYQLIYNLYQRNNTQRGAVIAESVNQAVAQLSEKIQRLTGQNQRQAFKHTYRSDFANEMLAAALEAIQTENYPQASKLLHAAISTEPENITAKRLLLQTLVQSSQPEEVYNIAQPAIQQATESDSHQELARLKFWSAVSQIQLENLQQARLLLAEAKTSAMQSNDWLYLGYIAEASGKIYQAQQDYVKAKAEFQSAIKSHQVIQCPNGQAIGLISLGELAMVQGNKNEAQEKFEESLSLSKERELYHIQALSEQWINRVRTLEKK